MNDDMNQTAVKFFTERLFSTKGIVGSYMDINNVVDVYNLIYEKDRLHKTYKELESEKLVRTVLISDTVVKVYLTKEGVDFIQMMLDFKKV